MTGIRRLAYGPHFDSKGERRLDDTAHQTGLTMTRIVENENNVTRAEIS